MHNLNNLRAKIDKIDTKILSLIKDRMEIAKRIGKLKEAKKIKITDKKREKEVLSKAKTPQEKSILKKIILESKKVQKSQQENGI